MGGCRRCGSSETGRRTQRSPWQAGRATASLSHCPPAAGRLEQELWAAQQQERCTLYSGIREGLMHRDPDVVRAFVLSCANAPAVQAQAGGALLRPPSRHSSDVEISCGH